MASLHDIAPTVLAHLPVNDLVALAQTTTYNSSDDVWNVKLAQLGYPRVPLAQGLYFIVVTHGFEDRLVAAINGGVMAHIDAVMKRHNLKEANIVEALRHVTSELEGEVRRLVISVMKTSTEDPRKYVNYSPAILQLLPEVLTEDQARRFVGSISRYTIGPASEAIRMSVTLARIHQLKPSYVPLTTETVTYYLLDEAWLFCHRGIDVYSNHSLHSVLVDLYPELERRATEDPLTYCGSLIYTATQHLSGDDFIEPSLTTFFSANIRVLLTLPAKKFDAIWSWLSWLSVDDQLTPIITATKTVAISEGCIVELVMRVVSSEHAEEGTAYLWPLNYEDIVLPADKWDEFISRILGYMSCEDFLPTYRVGIPLAYAEEYIASHPIEREEREWEWGGDDQ